MEREILFRVFDTFEQKMIYEDVASYISFNDNGSINNHNFFGETHVMQFTGMTDKHGTKIFEGDILKGISDNPFAVNLEKNYLVIWGVDHWHIKNTLLSLQELFNYCNRNIEVIGNIHQNPELLNQ